MYIFSEYLRKIKDRFLIKKISHDFQSVKVENLTISDTFLFQC
jgi:hypothetical protein